MASKFHFPISRKTDERSKKRIFRIGLSSFLIAIILNTINNSNRVSTFATLLLPSNFQSIAYFVAIVMSSSP